MKFSELENFTKSRLEKSKKEIQDSIKSIQTKRSLDAEPDIERKILRIQSVTGVSTEQAKKIANYDEDALSQLSTEKRAGAERIQGKTVDFVSVSFLDLARNAANSVGRVIYPNLRGIGTGFMISQDLFLTNNHVIENEEQASNYLIQFDYELDTVGNPKNTTIFSLDPDTFFITFPDVSLDFTVVAIGDRIRGGKSLGSFGFCPLLETPDKHVVGEFVNIIQHPSGDFKQLVLRENQIVQRVDTLLHYLADTEPGSSGSPVFNDQWEPIALHHYGAPSRNFDVDGKPLDKNVNEGIRISSIKKEMARHRKNFSGNKLHLLDQVLNPPFRHPSGSSIHDDSFLETNSLSVQKASGKIMIPLELSITLGDFVKTGAKITDEIEQPPLSEKVVIDENYSNRSGYDPDFLLNYTVPLPQLIDDKIKDAAKILNSNNDDHELKYQHFSIIMNSKQKMAFFTAANIDGPSWIKIYRKTGLPKEESAEKEKWYEDPRISLDEQTNQDLYDHQKPYRVFDRGHLVRREYPAWGTKNSAIRANADTFHFTNCVPQHKNFNQRSEYWYGIENYVINNTKNKDVKVSVFTGPVFGENDPEYRGIKVPLMFWKILVREENDELLATGFIADQSKVLNRLPERIKEGFDDLSKVEEYQTSIKEIEDLTGLYFGLEEYDTFEADPGESMKRIKISSFGDIKLKKKINCK